MNLLPVGHAPWGTPFVPTSGPAPLNLPRPLKADHAHSSSHPSFSPALGALPLVSASGHRLVLRAPDPLRRGKGCLLAPLFRAGAGRPLRAVSHDREWWRL